MKNTLKALVASSAAAFLLIGGAGTLAYWETSDSAGAGDLTAGSLTLTDGTSTGWTLNGVAVADPSAVRVVPGDELAWTGSFVIEATGENLEGDLTVTGADEGGTLAPYVTTTAVDWTVGSRDGATTITSADDGAELEAAVTVDFPFGTSVDNASQGKVLDLTDVAVTLTQTDATPPQV